MAQIVTLTIFGEMCCFLMGIPPGIVVWPGKVLGAFYGEKNLFFISALWKFVSKRFQSLLNFSYFCISFIEHQKKSFPHVENWASMISVSKTEFSGGFGSILQQSPLTKLFCFNRFQPEILHVFMISNLETFTYNAKTFFNMKKWYFI